MDFIQPERVGNYWFRGKSPLPQGRIFGGQVLAQSLMAANMTVDESHSAHSMHAYFLRAGDPNIPIEFAVDPIQTDELCSTRRVVAKQNNQAIFNTSIGYRIFEDGFQHSGPSPVKAGAEDTELYHAMYSSAQKPDFFDLYCVERRRVVDVPKGAGMPTRLDWFKGKGSLRDDARLHQATLALISDFSLLGTCIYHQGYNNWQNDLMAASLDHAIWFHEPVNLNEQVLYGCDSPWAGNARGFNRGKFWDATGKLVASTTQEALVRIKK